MRLSEMHLFFYHMRVFQFRLQRHLQDLFLLSRFAEERREENLPFIVKRHQSLLRRRLGDSDPQLQENKIVNLGIAIQKIDGILIPPGKIFSVWRLVGKTSKRKGYMEGLTLSRGEVKTGVGGGLCQLSNLLYWMALHTPMKVVERHHHSFDPFPDERRVLPFGSGASLFYNYVDLRFLNTTETTFQIRLWMTDKHLKGTIYASQPLEISYSIQERKHRFLKKEGKNYRENEIWRIARDKRSGKKMGEELIIHNFAEVKYELPDPFPPESDSMGARDAGARM
ncbi:MAG: VanW family protein [Thermicanus sp.]|nr:VanW family protein [Thermicanus sp.]